MDWLRRHRNVHEARRRPNCRPYTGFAMRAGLLVVMVAAIVVCACSNPAASDVPELSPLPSDPAFTTGLVTAPPTASAVLPTGSRLAVIRHLLIDSAQRHGVNPYLVMGVAWWESGWDQSRVSSTGAIGIMQVEPATAASAGPQLLHRVADINNQADNIELGVAVLKEDLDNFHNDLAKALIAYYEGPAAVTDWNQQDAGAKRYVWGVYRLAVEFSQGTGPA